MKKKDIRATLPKGSQKSMMRQRTQDELAKMRDMDIREADLLELSDILEIKIDDNLSDTEKKREFIRQIGNPYLYRQGEYIVKLSFADTDVTLTDRLKEYIEHVAATGL